MSASYPAGRSSRVLEGRGNEVVSTSRLPPVSFDSEHHLTPSQRFGSTDAIRNGPYSSGATPPRRFPSEPTASTNLAHDFDALAPAPHTPPRHRSSTSDSPTSVSKTPPPTKRSFFGFKSPKTAPSTPIAPGPPAPVASRRSVKLTKNPGSSPSEHKKRHSRGASNGELGMGTENTASRSTEATSKVRMSQSVGPVAGSRRPARGGPPPERDDWDMMDDPELRNIASNIDYSGTPSRTHAADVFASPTFYPKTPPKSDRVRGSLDRGAVIPNLGSVGDVGEWYQSGEGHEDRQASGRTSYEQVARDIVGSMPPTASYSAHVPYPMTPPEQSRASPHRISGPEKSTSIITARGPTDYRGFFSTEDQTRRTYLSTFLMISKLIAFGSGRTSSESPTKGRISSDSSTKRSLPPRRDSLQQHTNQASSYQKASSQTFGMAPETPISPRRDTHPPRRDSLQGNRSPACRFFSS
ncbi:hypothetical protein P7C70_g7588, partial [Phenoliferia sp. Uapishka_3]